ARRRARSPRGRARPSPAEERTGAARGSRARAPAARRRRRGRWCRSYPGRSRGSTVRVDERERAAPRVLGRVRELLLLAVEEAVRCAVVDDDLMLDARSGERTIERRVVVRRDALVVAGLQGEDRARDRVDALARACPAPRPGRRAVEADRPGEAVARR